MGWATANHIFDRTAEELIKNHVEPEKVTNVLAVLIEELCDGDWDTLNESIDQFTDTPSVMAAFYRAAPDWLGDDDDA